MSEQVLGGYEHTQGKDDENKSVEVYEQKQSEQRNRIRFNEEYNWIASGSMDCSVIIYDYDSNRVRK